MHEALYWTFGFKNKTVKCASFLALLVRIQYVNKLCKGYALWVLNGLKLYSHKSRLKPPNHITSKCFSLSILVQLLCEQLKHNKKHNCSSIWRLVGQYFLKK